MSRIHMVDPTQSTSEQKALLDTIQSQLGMAPNFLKVLANSPAALKAFLGLHSVAHSGTLSLQTRERIALALAQHNACAYCVAAHTAIAHKAGLSQDDLPQLIETCRAQMQQCIEAMDQQLTQRA